MEDDLRSGTPLALAALCLALPLQAIAAAGAPLSPTARPFVLSEDAGGHFNTGNLAVFGYSADAPGEDDPQVYDYLKPDMVLRSWFADRGDDTLLDGYNRDFHDNCKDAHIVFMAGVNATALYAGQAPSSRAYDQWTTADVKGRPVPHPEYKQPQFEAALRTAPAGRGDIGAARAPPPPMRRVSLAHPQVAARLLKQMEAQIDLGADGVVLTEADALGYRGNAEKGYNGDEGYDRYFLADFNRHLIDKYPDYRQADWEINFQMGLSNTINPWFPFDELRYNFDYRRYMGALGWAHDPRNRGGLPDRPLAAEWGDLPYPTGAGPVDEQAFLPRELAYIQKRLILKIRKYARSAQHREILVAAEGMLPDVDMHQYPLKRVNRDDGEEAVDYLPTTWNGSLKGSVSLLPAFKALRARSRRISSQALLVLYLGLGEEDYASRYNRLDVEEKEAYWRIYVPEAYACGAFFAFHLKESLGQQPSSIQAGVMDYMSEAAGFYKRNRGLFTSAEDGGRGVRCDNAHVACNVTEQAYWRRSVVHLINHNFQYKMTPLADVTVSVASEVAPAVAYLRSPDLPGSTPVAFTFRDGQVALKIPSLAYYDVVVLKWPVEGPRKRGEAIPTALATPPPRFAQAAPLTPTPMAVAVLPRARPALPALPRRSQSAPLAQPLPLPLPELPLPAPLPAPALPAAAPSFPPPALQLAPPAPAALPSPTPCVPGTYLAKQRVWVPAQVGDTRALGLKAALRVGTRPGDLEEYGLAFDLSASARVWAEAEATGLNEADPNAAPEVFLDDQYLGPLQSRQWRSSRASALEAGRHKLVVRRAAVPQAPTVTLGRLRVLSEDVGRWDESSETRPCGCGGPPCP